MDFTPDTLMTTWAQDGFRIELHHSDRPPAGRHIWVGYRLFDDTWAALTGAQALIFSGDDLAVAAHPVDGASTVTALCSFLSCTPGDVEDAYFASYTPTQLAWRDARADDLGRWGGQGSVVAADRS